MTKIVIILLAVALFFIQVASGQLRNCPKGENWSRDGDLCISLLSEVGSEFDCLRKIGGVVKVMGGVSMEQGKVATYQSQRLCVKDLKEGRLRFDKDISRNREQEEEEDK